MMTPHHDGTASRPEEDVEALELRQLEAAVAEGRAAVEAGQVVDHERVREWLMALASGDFSRPPPEPAPRT